jgi:CHASE2 domain-containing sensor protein
MALAGWALVAGAREAWRNLQRTRGTATGALLAGVACACLGFLVHGWVDFNFHIPANAANFSVLAVVLTRRGWDED